MHLADNGAGTILTYEVDAKVGGKLAQLGSRIIDSFAKKMADQFFERFQSAVEGDAPQEATPAEAVAEAAADTAEEVAPKKGLLKRIFGA